MQRFGSGVATLILVVIALCIFFPTLQKWEQPLGRIMMLVVGLASVSPMVIFQVLFPPAFDISSSKKSITYEFKHEEDAIAFSELNEDAEWVEIS